MFKQGFMIWSGTGLAQYSGFEDSVPLNFPELFLSRDTQNSP